jgi:hypothetical protein
MALSIEQNPLYTLNPVGQELIFTVLDTATVGAYFNVKYVAEVHISTVDIDLATTTAIVGTFKTTPNNTGAGMYDFRPIVESFVSPDNLAALVSEYKGAATTAIKTHPLHLIDKYSLNDNVVRYLKIRFTIEGSSTATGTVEPIAGEEEDSVQYTLINGYLKYTDVINRDATGNFGFNTGVFQLDAVASGRFLTNAPTTQYANINDYGTLSFMATPVTGSVSTSTVDYLKIILYDESGSQLGTDITIDNVDGNGGNTTWDSATKNQLLHLGCFPANLKNWSSVFLANMTDLSYYTIQAFTSVNLVMSELITINVNCPTLKGFEPIRLTWLNQWGVWDYYTFKMKSTKSISTKGSTYQQLGGTWNESIYLPNGYKGGKKAFRVNATEKVVMNTDFVNQSESEWFEELINSPEVYILEGFQVDATLASPNTYVTPVRLTTSSYTRKTVANDKLMQYTFEVEKSKTLRTQSV